MMDFSLVIRRLILMVIILFPFAVWKVIEIFISIFNHLKISWE